MSYGTPRSESLPLSPWIPSKARPGQASAKTSPTFLGKDGHEYDLEALDDLHTRAIDEAENENHEQARMMFLETLDGYESLAGPCHYSTIKALSSFVSSCEILKSFDEANDRLRKSLYHHQMELGRQHKNTLESMARLGHFYMRQKRYGQSESNLMTAKFGLEDIFRLDPEASFIATKAINEDLMDIYEQQENFDRCEQEYLSAICKLEALQTTQKHYNKMIYDYKHSLAHVYRLMWDVHICPYPYRPPPLIKAETLLLDILEFSERSPGVTLLGVCAFDDLRLQYHSFDEDERLDALLNRAVNKINLIWDARSLLRDQPELLELELGIARSYAKLGNKETAEWWFLRFQAETEQSSGPNSTAVIRSLVHTARFYLDQNAWEDAERLLRDAQRRAENSEEVESETELEPMMTIKRRIAQCLADRVWEPCCRVCGI